jgi:hypothetical protein
VFHVAATVECAMPPKRITDEDVLRALADLAGDGYCLVADVLPSLPKLSHADRQRALQIERRGREGRMHVAIASEGWRRLRAA